MAPSTFQPPPLSKPNDFNLTFVAPGWQPEGPDSKGFLTTSSTGLFVTLSVRRWNMEQRNAMPYAVKREIDAR
jgi:hypothetical protein